MSIDGRTARRDRNRDAVLDAAIELFGEGHIPPTPAAVAERSGVSLRSVYRYFADHDALVTAAVARFVERNEGLFVLDVPVDVPLGQRIEGLVEARLRLYEALAPVVRVVTRQGDDLPLLNERLATRRRLLTEQVLELFAQELASAGAGIADAVDALTQFESLEHLRSHRALSRRRTHSALVDGLGRLLVV